MALRLQEAAALLLDEIFCFTRESWGDAQAERSITDRIRAFLMIDTHGVTSRPLPAEFEVDGSGFDTLSKSSIGSASRMATSAS